MLCRSSLFLLVSVAAPGFAAEPVDYLKDVKPILTVRCYACHGSLQQKAGLRADTAKALIDAGAVVPGKSAMSPIMAHVQGKPGVKKMPPAFEGETLTEAQVDVLRAWIDAGAIAPANEPSDPDPREHWAFRRPVRGPIPNVSTRANAHPIDTFLAAEWAKQGLEPKPAAENGILLRRVYLDLAGLPPTSEQLDEFLKNPTSEAYETIVDRLLASPQYGERWGRHFLDLWRYSDWWGLGAEVRNSQKHMWHWRDWTIESLNADTGYDAMIRSLLAADELTPTDPKQLRATGYLARQYFKFNRTTWMDETIEHTAKAFLGLTVNCAKCHDHKYDPISHNDYYRLRAIFEPYQVRMDLVPGELNIENDGLPRAFDCNLDAPTYKHERGDERRPLTGKVIAPGIPPLLAFAEYKPVPVALPGVAFAPQLRPEVVALYRELATKEGELAVRAVEARATADRLKVLGWPSQFHAAARTAAKAEKQLAFSKLEFAHLKAEWAVFAKKPDAVKKRDAAKAAAIAARITLDVPSEAYTSLKGSIKTAESNVEPEVHRNLPFPTTSTGRRTALANWIADARNPLTARVLVNHVWARHFGKPLVATVFDFGRKGAKPTHPELLDWLAVEFTEHNWSLKHLHKLIVTSRAYRMSSSTAGAAANLKADPENRYLWRQNSVRMEAQVVRDSLLQLAGKLDLTLGGPAVPPAAQDASLRRSLYFFQSHNEHHKFLMQFDDANVLECYRRTESIVPQQALTLANSKFALTMAEAIAEKLRTRHGKATDEAYVTAAFAMILSTSPSVEEVAACVAALNEWRSVLLTQKHPDPVMKARSDLVVALLNHNDFVTVR